MKKYLLYFAICFVSSLLLGLTLIWPKAGKLSALREEIALKELNLLSQENYFKDLTAISEEVKKYESSLSKIDSALPQKFSLPDILNFIQTASSQSGLSLKTVSPTLSAPSQEEKEIKKKIINVVLTGDYGSFKNFLSILENSSRLIEVENIAFDYSKEGAYNFNLTIAVYSY